MRSRVCALSLLVFTGVMLAQSVESRRATMTGSRGDRGKCTIEVEVDGTAEVEVSGDSGRIRTLFGQRSGWRRFECSDPLPRNPVDFRFKGIDGRGQVNLVREPREGRGIAVVRIDDPKGGREGYTFDLEWTGNSGSYSGGGYGRDSSDRRRDGRYDRGGYDDDRRNTRYTLRCEADGNRRSYCEADTRGGVRLLRGNGACREGSTWGYDRRGIWVERGCRAEFEVGR